MKLLLDLFRLSAHDVRVGLLLTGFALALLGAWVWLLVRGFRRQPPGVLRLTFLDARGVPNGVLLTVFLAVLMMALCTLVGLMTGRWAPAYVWGGWFGIAAWGIGADALVTGLTPAAFTQHAYGLDAAQPAPGYGSDPTAAASATVPPSSPTSPSSVAADAVS